MLIERYLSLQVKKDLRRKMVFVGGPRQVGKTTLARSLLKSDAGYLSWDVPEHRERRYDDPGVFYTYPLPICYQR